MYKDKDDRVHKTCEKLNQFLTQNKKELKEFKTLCELEQHSKAVFDRLDLEFQNELKGKLHSGDILHPSAEKEEKIIPGLHNNETLWEKIYFWFKNNLTKHAHSALMVFDKDDNYKMHYSHVADKYRHNTVELHHLLYSDIYQVRNELFEGKRAQTPDANKSALEEYRLVHENLYSLTKEQATKGDALSNTTQQVRLENNTFRRIMAGFIDLIYRIFPKLGSWIAKDTDPDEAISSVLTASPKSAANRKGPAVTNMFCSEFVANTLAIAAVQTPALCDTWKIHRRSRYVPPEALAQHLTLEKLENSVETEKLDLPLMRMFK